MEQAKEAHAGFYFRIPFLDDNPDFWMFVYLGISLLKPAAHVVGRLTRDNSILLVLNFSFDLMSSVSTAVNALSR